MTGVQTCALPIYGQELAQLMIDNNVGVSIVSTYEIKKIDSDYFTDE